MPATAMLGLRYRMSYLATDCVVLRALLLHLKSTVKAVGFSVHAIFDLPKFFVDVGV